LESEACMLEILTSLGGWGVPGMAAAAGEGGNSLVNLAVLVQHLVAALVFSLLGVGVFVLAIGVLSRMLPFSLRKELEEDQNMAIGIIIGCVFLGIAIIIAAAMTG